MDIRVVDIFAGPGGLGEGFSRYRHFYGNDTGFSNVLSIEKDQVAVQTLTLRNWVHQYGPKNLPDIYYKALHISAKR